MSYVITPKSWTWRHLPNEDSTFTLCGYSLPYATVKEKLVGGNFVGRYPAQVCVDCNWAQINSKQLQRKNPLKKSGFVKGFGAPHSAKWDAHVAGGGW